MVASMASNPIIFAMANPDPEITPEEVKAVRDDAIIATGRSDYPNQVNNVLGFPYIFRGALDVRASTINNEMKIAAAKALASLAREDVPDEVAAAYAGERLQFGPDYIIPAPFDPRLISTIPPAVAAAAMDSGAARRPIVDIDAYCNDLSARLNPAARSLQLIFERLSANPQRMVFAEGEEERVIRAAALWRNNGYGVPILVGNADLIEKTAAAMGLGSLDGFEIESGPVSAHNARYTDFLYQRLQRRGALYRDCLRMVTQNRNVFAACMVAMGDADAMITGITRSYWVSLEDIRRVLDPAPGARVFGLSLMLTRGMTLFIADSTVHPRPSPEQLADITIQAAAKAREMGYEPRVALLSFSTFGNPLAKESDAVRAAIDILDSREIDFEYDGELSADVALDAELLKIYPFCRLSGPANVLVMPGLHSANIATHLLQKLGGGTVIGPILLGLGKPAQIVQMGATVSDIINLAALAAPADGA